MKLNLFFSVVLLASVILGACASEQTISSEPSPSASPANTSSPTPKPSPQTASTPTITPILYKYNKYEPPYAAIIDGEIYPDEEKSQTFLITDASAVGFGLNWLFDYELSMTLTSPSGRLIDSSIADTDPDIIYSLDFLEDYATHTESYQIANPEQGNWTAHIRSVKVPQSGELYSMQVVLKTNLTLSLLLKGMEYKPGEAMTIVVDLTRNGTCIINASVTADIKTPSKMIDTIVLYDDGLHGDNEPDDGRYANEYMNTNLWGNYYITVTALGTVNGVEFQRQALAWTVVELYPDLSVDASEIYFSNENPDEGEEITITAIIRNVGEADARQVKVYFEDGEPYQDSIGVDMISLPKGGSAQASVTWDAIPGDHIIYVDALAVDAAYDNDYSNDSAFKLIHVNGPVPMADAGGPYIGYEGSPIGFDAGNSTGLAGCTLEYRWDYDSKGGWDVFSPSSPIAVNMWDDEWTGNVTVEVRCGKLISRNTAPLIVENAPPVVEAGDNQMVYKGDTVNLSGDFWDPGEKDTHTATIDWGDGIVDLGNITATGGLIGNTYYPVGGNVTGSHIYQDSGIYTVTLTVTDDDGGVGADTARVFVPNSP